MGLTPAEKRQFVADMLSYYGYTLGLPINDPGRTDDPFDGTIRESPALLYLWHEDAAGAGNPVTHFDTPVPGGIPDLPVTPGIAIVAPDIVVWPAVLDAATLRALLTLGNVVITGSSHGQNGTYRAANAVVSGATTEIQLRLSQNPQDHPGVNSPFRAEAVSVGVTFDDVLSGYKGALISALAGLDKDKREQVSTLLEAEAWADSAFEYMMLAQQALTLATVAFFDIAMRYNYGLRLGDAAALGMWKANDALRVVPPFRP